MYPKTLLLSSCAFASIAKCLNTNLTLPWGTWQASPLTGQNKVYIFQNVRFGSVPTRFGNSSYPTAIPDNSTIQNSSYGPSCIQVNTNTLKNPPGGRPELGDGFLAPPPDMDQSEDCLFLDIYVPASALKSNAKKLPVVVWLYGGAYAFGSKLNFGPEWPFYTGQGLIEAANNNVIFVAGNYRLGAFGWLAGSYMEKHGLPNAGLYDQRLMLQWVQDWIGSVGGDHTSVSAWGESAGAGSILHHLIQANGTRDPLFSKALLQSPAFEWQWDRSGTMDTVYQNFSALAGCGAVHDINCLQSADIAMLTQANQKLFANAHQTGLFPVGPSVDGKWIDQIPAAQFAAGFYWHSLDSIVVSHVGNESGIFTPAYVVSNATFETFLNEFMPEQELILIRAAIRQQYNCTESPYNGDYRLCVSILIRDSTFTCNTRQLYDAYRPKAYMMQYSFPAPYNASALHATDLLPTFINSGTNVTALLEFFRPNISDPHLAATTMSALHQRYQKYLGSYAAYGNPNKGKHIGTPTWSFATNDSNQVQSVLEVRLKPKGTLHPFFDIISDTTNTQASCGFWTDIAKNISKISSAKAKLTEGVFVQKPELELK